MTARPPAEDRARGLPRRTVLLGLTAGAAVTVLPTSCAPPAPPAERTVNLGLESVLVDEQERTAIGRRLAAVAPTGVNLAVGRVDWTAFPWEAHPGSAASAVAESGRDEVASAIASLREHLGEELPLTLTIDALAPRLLAEHPELAGRDLDGARHPEVASVAALEDGTVGDLLVDRAGEVARRYRPRRLALTELFVDTHTFGEEDLASYRRASGAEDWPRREDGEVDRTHESLGRWRSRALTALLARVREEIAPTGVALEMDVRSPREDPAADRPLSGHDYDLLLTAADRIAVWNYFGLDGQSPAHGARIAEELAARHPGRFSLCTGLWAEDGTLSPRALRRGLRELAAQGAGAVAVTPLSLLAPEHWDVLAEEWTRD
jgi:hypothetical protein